MQMKTNRAEEAQLTGVKVVCLGQDPMPEEGFDLSLAQVCLLSMSIRDQVPSPCGSLQESSPCEVRLVLMSKAPVVGDSSAAVV